MVCQYHHIVVIVILQNEYGMDQSNKVDKKNF